jgi:hypothetical protein
MRITATEMVGVRLSSSEVQRLLDALAAGKLGPRDDPELLALQRKLTVMLQVATAAESRAQAR